MQPDCTECRELLWSYLSKELSPSEAKKIEEHLQGCPSCRQEAEELSLVIASLGEEVPLPANFSQELHEKLVSVAEEMANETPTVKEKLLNGLKALPRSRTFRTLAPALACLVLVIGVFSTGLFDKWNSADTILTDPVSVTEEPSSTKEPSVQEKSVTPKSDIPEPIPTPPSSDSASVTQEDVSEPQPEPVIEAPSEASQPETPAVVSQPEPSAAESEHLPAPASIEEGDAPATFAIPRRLPMIVCLNVADAEEFLNNWRKDWESALQDIAPEELISGADPDAIILKLSKADFDSLMEYSDSQELLETQGETLIIIAEDEE